MKKTKLMLNQIQQQAAASFLVEGDHGLSSEESKVEHCVFLWTIKKFFEEKLRKLRKYSKFNFQASKNEKSQTWWQLDLSWTRQQNYIKIRLTRLKSENQALVFVRFRWEILDTNGNKVFPGSIHSLVYQDDSQSKNFVEIDKLLEDSQRFLPDGDLHICCELTAYERTIEERISSLVKGNIKYALNGLMEDFEKLFFTSYGADMRVSSMDGHAMYCHKAILSERSTAFATMIAAVQSDDCHLHLGEIKGDVLVAILTHLYSGNLDMYLEHTIPKDLYSVATEYSLKYLTNHLDHVNSNGLTSLKSLDVTWTLPHFKSLILQPKVTLYCPGENTSTIYDKRWSFKLEFDSSRDGVDISVVRNWGEDFEHYVKFIVQIEGYGQTFERRKTLKFVTDGAQGIKAFITKDDLCGFLSEDESLVLRCSLEVLRLLHRSSSLKILVEEISNHTEECLLKMAEDLRRMFARKTFSNAVVNSKMGRIDYHSFIAKTRFELPEWQFKAFARKLNPHLIQPFFLFLYGGDAVGYKALGIKRFAEMRGLKKIVEKIADFLVFYLG